MGTFSVFHFFIGLVLTWVYVGLLGLTGWKLGQPMASDRGKWRIFWERAAFRDMMMILRWGGCAVLVALAVMWLSLFAAYSFLIGVLLGLLTRVVGELPAILLVRYGVTPSSKASARSNAGSGGSGDTGNGRDL